MAEVQITLTASCVVDPSGRVRDIRIVEDREPPDYRDIPGLPGYRVGTDGSVWSCWRLKGLGQGRGTMAVMSHMHWRQLKPFPIKTGHLQVDLGRGKPRSLVHRLVLTTFVGPCPDRMQGCHNDGDPANCRLSNLRWDTPQANQLDSVRHGTKPRGERHWKARVTEADVRAIRAGHAAGVPYATLAAKYDISKGSVKAIVTRRNWSHVA
jgi:hypothetical protein